MTPRTTRASEESEQHALTANSLEIPEKERAALEHDAMSSRGSANSLRRDDFSFYGTVKKKRAERVYIYLYTYGRKIVHMCTRIYTRLTLLNSAAVNYAIDR